MKKISIIVVIIGFISYSCNHRVYNTDAVKRKNISGYLMVLAHEEYSYPDYHFESYFILPSDALDFKYSLKSIDSFLQQIDKYGGVKILDFIDGTELLACCESTNIHAGHDAYLNGDFTKDTIDSYVKKSDLISNILTSVKQEKFFFEIRRKQGGIYRFKIYNLMAECCYCRRLFGTDVKKYAYIKDIKSLVPFNQTQIRQVQEIFR